MADQKFEFRTERRVYCCTAEEKSGDIVIMNGSESEVVGRILSGRRKQPGRSEIVARCWCEGFEIGLARGYDRGFADAQRRIRQAIGMEN